MRGGLLEAPSIFLLITSLAEGHWWGLMWAGAFQVLQLATFPTLSGVESWIRTQHELMDFDRMS